MDDETLIHEIANARLEAVYLNGELIGGGPDWHGLRRRVREAFSDLHNPGGAADMVVELVREWMSEDG